VPNLVTNLISDMLYSSGMRLDLAPKTDTKKDICLKRDWTMRSKYDNHFKLNSQHNWGNLFDHAPNTRMSTLIMSKIFIRAPINYEEKRLRPRSEFASHLILIACLLF
jgi:hypothetical protein